MDPRFAPAVYGRLAVYVEDRSRRLGRDGGGIRQVEDEFMRAALAKGYVMVARSDLERVLEEQRRQNSPITEAALARYARILNASGIILVSVNEVSTQRYQPAISFGNQQRWATSVSISARLISAELGQVVWISSYSGAVEVADRRGEGRAAGVIASIVASGLPQR